MTSSGWRPDMSEPGTPSPAVVAPLPDRGAPRRPRSRVALISALVVGVVLVALVVVFAQRLQPRSTPVSSPLIGELAPQIVGETIDGAPFDLDDQRGRWVLVNFFATWCVPCREEHDDLVRFSERHERIGDASVVGVIFADPAAQVRAFRADNGGTWPMVVDGDGRIAVTYGVRGVPESFLIAPDGTVVTKIIGGVRDTDLDALLARLTSGGG